ncbi:monoheme cytochrome SoxX (sulfur oxidation) [Sulfitobacter brevis]|uniref:Monoheme cytochrome SoxX (Sulfur oxidation) n=2 Tax=Sulfitobacter brevis TaxID=74348 RepID=A0A1I1ZEQ0_9RHOB|nr:monoheme cytochrome SoxX (sulfur oxidation) [Sulfitobacter brevis]
MMKWIAIAALSSVAGMASAEAVAPADVQFDDYGAVEVSLSGTPGDAANGAAIVGDKKQGNCVACHQVGALADIPFQGEIGPALNGAGDRWTEAELRGIVSNSKKTFEGSMMPSYYKTTGYIRPGDAFTGKAASEPLPPLMDAQMIEDVVAFLATLKE